MDSTTGPAAVFALVRQRSFGPYFAGNALSASGTWFQNLAAALLVYRLTHSAFLLGVLNFCQFAPVLVLAPWAGSAADRYDRRRLLLAAQTTASALAATLAILAWSGLAAAWVVILFALGLGVTSATSIPPQQALIASLVEPESLPTAVALNSMTYNLARAVGPALGAASVEYLGIPASFLLNSFSYLVFVLALLVLRPRAQETAPRETSRLRDALGLLRDDPRLLAFLIVVAAVGFASDPVNTLAPAFAHAFGHRDTVAGFIIGAFGAGAVSAALLVARSADGVTWSPPVRVPTGAADAELPGIAADRSAGGRIALAYYRLRGSSLDVFAVSSRNGGATWRKPQRLSSRSVPLGWVAKAGGAMVGDYISTSFAGGRAVPVFALGFRPRGSRLHESMFATSLAIPH